MDAIDTNSIISSFSYFRDLPKELQDQVWEHAINMVDDRVVEIKADSSMTSTCPIPALLHVSQDSRRRSLKRWKLAIGEQISQRKIFFDNARDVLFFGSDFLDMTKFGKKTYPANGVGVRNIAFSLEQQWGDTRLNLRTTVRKMCTIFPDLTNITFLNMNLDFDFEALARGDDQPLPALSPQERSITFEAVPPEQSSPTNQIRRRLLTRLRTAFKEEELACPTWQQMNYRYVPRH